MHKFIKKGITLIEIIIALAILSILTTVLSPFFISNFKAFHKADNNLDLQREGEKIIEQISYSSMKAIKVEKLIDNMGNDIDLTNTMANSISGIHLKVKKFDEGSGSVIDDVIPLNFDINNIETISIKALPDGNEIEEAEGLHIEVKLDASAPTPELKTEVYFRNHEE